MKIITVIAALVVLHAVGTAQLSRVSNPLASEDPTKRKSAARELAAQVPLRPEEKTALIDLLAREKGLVQPGFPAGSGASGDGEGYAEYFAWLTGEVMKIADEEPDRSDVWNALLAAYPGNGQKDVGRWLGKHGDEALPYLLAYARDHRTDSLAAQNRIDALTSLAQVVAYERQPGVVHHCLPPTFRRLRETPSEKVFARHFILKDSAGTNSGSGPYYDPSYGVTYTGNCDFEVKAVDGYARQLGVIRPVHLTCGRSYRMSATSVLTNEEYACPTV